MCNHGIASLDFEREHLLVFVETDSLNEDGNAGNVCLSFFAIGRLGRQERWVLLVVVDIRR